MPRQCISKRNKNIKEREKTYNPVTFLQKSANNFLKMCNFSKSLTRSSNGCSIMSATRTRKGGDGLRDKYNFNYVIK